MKSDRPHFRWNGDRFIFRLSTPSAEAKSGWNSGALHFGKVVAHGTVGGLSSQAQGGSFADGFRSGGFTQFASPVVGATPDFGQWQLRIIQ